MSRPRTGVLESSSVARNPFYSMAALVGAPSVKRHLHWVRLSRPKRARIRNLAWHRLDPTAAPPLWTEGALRLAKKQGGAELGTVPSLPLRRLARFWTVPHLALVYGVHPFLSLPAIWPRVSRET